MTELFIPVISSHLTGGGEMHLNVLRLCNKLNFALNHFLANLGANNFKNHKVFHSGQVRVHIIGAQ